MHDDSTRPAASRNAALRALADLAIEKFYVVRCYVAAQLRDGAR